MIILSIIILSYNTKDLTLRCIRSIVNQYRKELEDKILEIIVVDNASSDGSPSEISRLRQDFGGQANLKLIQNKENVGFAKGCNIGAKAAEGKYLLFLNSDTQVFDRGFFKMTEFLDEYKEVGILGGKILDPDGTLQRSGGKFYDLWNLFLMLTGGERIGLIRKSPTKIERMDWISGACLMIKKDLFQKLSGFDEHFFMYIEDMELCFRVKKLGLSTYFFPDVKVKHKTLGSSNKAFAIINIYKGILYFYSKHKSYIEYIVAKLFLTAKAAVLIFIGIIAMNSNLRDRYQKALKF